MPKKGPKNPFYYFMMEFKEEMKNKGIIYPNNSVLQTQADPIWRGLSASEKAKYENMAKKGCKGNETKKFTSQGLPLSFIVHQQQEQQDMEEAEINDIKNMVKMKRINGTLVTDYIFLIDVNAYCKVKDQYLFGEVTVLRFNLKDGILDQFHEVIDIASMPVGYASDVMFGAEELGLRKPDEDRPPTDLMNTLATIVEYLNGKKRAVSLPPMFTVHQKVEQATDFIMSLCNKAGEDESIFKIYRLDTFFFYLINELKTRPDEGFPQQSLAKIVLDKDLFKYTPGLECEHHQSTDRAVECCMSRTRRWAFTLLDSCLPLAGIVALPGRHVPPGVDVKEVLELKEKKANAGSQEPVWSSFAEAASFANDSTMSCSSEASASNKTSEKRVHVPMRMPKTDYSQTIRKPPELSDFTFPNVTTSGAGRGRRFGSKDNVPRK